jgi:hypothetical protein
MKTLGTKLGESARKVVKARERYATALDKKLDESSPSEFYHSLQAERKAEDAYHDACFDYLLLLRGPSEIPPAKK